MGRKGGGRSGFLKASRMAPSAASDDEPETAAPAQPEVKAAKDAPAKTEPEPAVSKKASAFLVGAGSDDGSSDEDSGGRTKDGETRGKMMQRHKREAKAVKDQIKKLGKKGKDEGARLLAEMEARHAEELAQLVADPPADAVGEEDGLAEALGQASLAPKEGKKPTKAQRRREQKAREDAEREARIAAENAELGETERMAEERELQLLLKPLGLAVKDIPPDGHCLYRSLEDQLRALPDGGAGTLAAVRPDGDAEVNFLTLRQITAEHMRAHRDHFKDFVIEGDTADGSVADGDDAFDAYVNDVESTAAWGGHVEIQALSQALKAHIQVFSVGLPLLEVGEEHKGAGPTLRVSYLRHAYGLGEHYNSVVNAGAEDEEGKE